MTVAEDIRKEKYAMIERHNDWSDKRYKGPVCPDEKISLVTDCDVARAPLWPNRLRIKTQVFRDAMMESGSDFYFQWGDKGWKFCNSPVDSIHAGDWQGPECGWEWV